MKRFISCFIVASMFLSVAVTSCDKDEDKSVIVTFDSNGGSEMAAQSIKKGDKVPKPDNPARPHYEFDGWYNSTFTKSWDFDLNTVTSNITLYAKWEMITYTVTFDSNSGSEVDPQTVAENEKATEPTPPAKEDYKLVGWYTDNNTFNDKWDFDLNTVTGNIILYAKWELIFTKFTVTFNSNGGSEIDPQTVIENEKATEPALPTKEGYNLVGWYMDNNTFNNKWDFTVNTVTTDITLYAKWFMPINLLAGSSMETSDEQYWHAYYASSSILPEIPGGSITFGYTDDKPGDGSGGCVSLYHPGNISARMFLWQAVEVVSGKQYLFSARIKLPTGGAGTYFRFLHSNVLQTGSIYESYPFSNTSPVLIEINESNWNLNYDGDLAADWMAGSLRYNGGTQGVFTATHTGTLYLGISLYNTWSGIPIRTLIDDVKFVQISE